jgi:hypothetical protein
MVSVVLNTIAARDQFGLDLAILGRNLLCGAARPGFRLIAALSGVGSGSPP